MTASPTRHSLDDTQPIPIVSARGRHAAPRPRRSWRGWLWVVSREVAVVVGVAAVALAVLWALRVQVTMVADDAMEPTLAPGDRVVVTALGDPGAGDVVLVRSPEVWATPGGDAVVRVIGTPGQRVVCCDAEGRIAVDGQPLIEPYLDGPTDQIAFDIVVPEGRFFVLADSRETARDSRASLDDQMVTLPRGDVIGRVVFVAWPPRGPVD